MRVLVTGGCGFIGSNFVRYLLRRRPDTYVTVLDLLTYAGNLQNLADVEHHDRLQFVRSDIADGELVARAARGADAIVNFAAESHVDRSIQDAAPFIHTNVVGVETLLATALRQKVPRFVQISTDEVYGALGAHGAFTEESPLQPNNPYSASKAAADLLTRAYVRTHALSAVIVRPCNTYGPYQFPEKLIPLSIANALEGAALPLYGDGLHRREWLYVTDLCTAILRILEQGRAGEIYNVGSDQELTNLTVMHAILALLGAPRDLIRFVPDRPGHDRRYALDSRKILAELGWRPKQDFPSGLRETIAWYFAHLDWVESVRSGAYRTYYDRQYADRLAAGTPTRRALTANRP